MTIAASRRDGIRPRTARLLRWALALGTALWAAPAAPQSPWGNASPGGGGAFLSVDVSVAGKVLVGSDLSGAYLRSGTGSWRRLGLADGLHQTSVSCVRWSPVTGESALAGGKGGLFISANGGLSWQTTSGPPQFQSNFFGAIGWSRSHPSIVYVTGAASSGDTTVRLWKSGDGGFSWSAVAHDLPATEALRAVKVVVHPTDPNTLYLVTGDDGFTRPSVLTPKRALYRSTNGGVTWSLRSGSDSTLDVAVHPASPSTLLMTVANGAEHAGSLMRSADGGDTWTTTLDNTGAVFTNTGAVWWDPPNAYLINVGLDACPQIPANAGKFVSTDGGSTWSRIDNGSTWETGWTDCRHARGTALSGVANTLSARGEYWITSQFVWRYAGGKYESAFTTSAGPGRWITQGIDNAVPVCFADAQDASTFYAGYYDLGLWRTQDAGDSWTMINPALPEWNGYGGNATAVVADSARPGVVWATLSESSKPPYDLRVYRSTDAGATWGPPATGLPFPAFLYGLSMDRQSPAGSRRLWITADGRLYTSADDGATWQAASTAGGLPTTGLFVTEVDRRTGSNVFVGGWKGLWRSTDAGASWTKLSDGFDYTLAPGDIGGTNTGLHRVRWYGPHQILSDPFVSGRVWVTCYVRDTTEIPGLNRGLYVSTNDGTSWTEVKRGKFYRGIATDSLGRRAFLTSSPATSAGSNGSELDATAGREIGRSADGSAWTWARDPDDPNIRYPFGWTVCAGSSGQVWIGVPGYGFMRRFNPPVAVDDACVAYQGSAGTLFAVLANDYDPDAGDHLSLAAVDAAGTIGTVRIAGDRVEYVAPPSFSGVDGFRYTVRDAAGATASATVTVTVVARPLVQVVVPVVASSDDAEESATGVMNLTSTDLDLTFSGSNQTIGMRFTQVQVPRGAEIVGAYVQFKVDETTTEATSLTIRGEASDDAPTFTGTNGNISTRPGTVASVAWSPPPWTSLGAQGADQRTPDLSGIVSEIVSRSGWASGRALALVIGGTGRRVARSLNGDPAGSPVLHIDYLGPTPVGVGEGPRASFALHGVSPNPARGALRVEFSLANGRPARLELLDVTGRSVAALDVGSLGQGRHQVDLREGLRTGIYLVRLTQDGRSQSRKAVVLN